MKLKLTATLLALAGLSLLTGCENVTENVRERFEPVPPKIRQFNADTRQVSQAVVVAFKRLEFSLTGPAGASEIEAASPIHTNETLRESRQLVARVRLHDAGVGRTDVELLLSEQVTESSATGGSGERALREHGFYTTFFDTVQQVLQEHPEDSAASPQKNEPK